MNEIEREFMERLREVGDDIVNDSGMDVGIIKPDTMPHAYFNLLCYMIAYKTGTSLIHIMDMNLFDFVSYMYIIRETTPEDSTDTANNPEAKDVMRTMGG